ncbi:hypothetical protein D3C86_2252090 [compost metagenome]
MLVARVAAHRPGRLLAVVVQGALVVGLQVLDQPVAEFAGPGLDHLRAGIPVQFAQIVGDAA